MGRLAGAPTAELVGGPQLGKSYPQLDAPSHGRFKCASNPSPLAARPSSQKWSVLAWSRLANGKKRYHVNFAFTVSRLHTDLQVHCLTIQRATLHISLMTKKPPGIIYIPLLSYFLIVSPFIQSVVLVPFLAKQPTIPLTCLLSATQVET
jgi:hypothetical protein